MRFLALILLAAACVAAASAEEYAVFTSGARLRVVGPGLDASRLQEVGLVDAEDLDRKTAERLGLIKASEVLDISAFKRASSRTLTQRIAKAAGRKAKRKGSSGCLILVIIIIAVLGFVLSANK